jgi:hypothetical protein
MSKRRPWSPGDLQEARSLQQKLGDLLGTDPFTSESMQAVTRACDLAMVSLNDDYCQEMFSRLDQHAHRLLRTGVRDRYRIRTVLDALERRLGSLEVLRGANHVVARDQAVLAKP